MPAGTQISGEDGIVTLKNVGGAVIGDVPCLTNFTIDASASLNERSTKCMKSNGDGGSGSSGGWTNSSVESKSWTVALDFYFQEDQLIPGSVKLDPTNVGDSLDLDLFPNDSTTGKVTYSGTAIIESVGTPVEVSGDTKVSVQLKGTGALTKSIVA